MSFKEEIRQHMVEVKVQLQVMNSELKEHTKRSTNLEDRVKPLEDSHVFFNKLAKALIALTSLAAAVGAAYHYLIQR